MTVAPPKSRVEIQSNGFDPTAQFIGSDPFNGGASLALKVPTLATVSLPSAFPKNTGAQNRYLFKLASFQVGASGGCARIRGYRLQVELWAEQTSVSGNRFVRQTVSSPDFTLADANWSWHLRYIPQVAMEAVYMTGNRLTPVAFNEGTVGSLDGMAYRWSDTSALLYETVLQPAGDLNYLDLLDYVPPNQGRPWGEPLAGLGTFYGASTPWNDSLAWSALDIPCSSPGTYAIFCSVRQTNTSTRIALTPPSTFFQNGLSPEEQFLLNFPSAYIGAVGAALIVEYDGDECDSVDTAFGSSGGPCG